MRLRRLRAGECRIMYMDKRVATNLARLLIHMFST